MMVRLGFAIAAHLEPEILVVDEVLAVGDAEFQKKAIGKMQDVSKGEERTVLFVSHNMAAVRSLCTRGVMLKNGMVDYIGNIPDTLEHYLKNDDSAQKEKIIDNVKFTKSTLKITNIEINGTELSESTIQSNQRELTIKIEGNSQEDMNYDVMLILRNKDGMPYATYAKGHYMGDIQHQSAGNFTIERTILLPEILTRGDIYVDLFLHHPMVEYQLKAPNCCILETMGYQQGFGSAMNQVDNGFIGLNDK